MHEQRHHWANWARGERIFHKGDFKYIILDMLKDKPRHGYEIIRELENQFNGFYAPSPGAVYPTLQYLEEMEYVTSEVQDGKKIYTITETGRSFLVEKEKETAEIKAQMKNAWGCYGAEFKDEMRDVMKTFGDIGKTIGQKARQAGAEKLPLVKQALADAAKEIERIFKS
jgi:DNA-binding PadR family transcriptional regulator